MSPLMEVVGDQNLAAKLGELRCFRVSSSQMALGGSTPWLLILLAARAHCLTGPRPAVTAIRSTAATKGIPRRDLLVFGAAATTALGSARPAAASFGSARASVTSPPKLKQGIDLESFEALLKSKQAQVETLLLPSQAEQLLQEINTQRLELQAA